MKRNSLIISLNKLKTEKDKGELNFDRCLNILNEIQSISKEYNLKYKTDLNKEEMDLYDELEPTFEELNDILKNDNKLTLSEVSIIMQMLTKVTDDRRATIEVKNSIQIVADFLVDCIADNNKNSNKGDTANE